MELHTAALKNRRSEPAARTSRLLGFCIIFNKNRVRNEMFQVSVWIPSSCRRASCRRERERETERWSDTETIEREREGGAVEGGGGFNGVVVEAVTTGIIAMTATTATANELWGRGGSGCRFGAGGPRSQAAGETMRRKRRSWERFEFETSAERKRGEEEESRSDRLWGRRFCRVSPAGFGPSCFSESVWFPPGLEICSGFREDGWAAEGLWFWL